MSDNTNTLTSEHKSESESVRLTNTNTPLGSEWDYAQMNQELQALLNPERDYTQINQELQSLLNPDPRVYLKQLLKERYTEEIAARLKEMAHKGSSLHDMMKFVDDIELRSKLKAHYDKTNNPKIITPVTVLSPCSVYFMGYVWYLPRKTKYNRTCLFIDETWKPTPHIMAPDVICVATGNLEDGIKDTMNGLDIIESFKLSENSEEVQRQEVLGYAFKQYRSLFDFSSNQIINDTTVLFGGISFQLKQKTRPCKFGLNKNSHYFQVQYENGTCEALVDCLHLLQLIRDV